MATIANLDTNQDTPFMVTNDHFVGLGRDFMVMNEDFINIFPAGSRKFLPRGLAGVYPVGLHVESPRLE